MEPEVYSKDECLFSRTLDAMDMFSVSVNPYDHILSLVPSIYGIWISLRGSSILELWDPRTLNCRMLYDTRTDRYPQLRKVRATTPQPRNASVTGCH